MSGTADPCRPKLLLIEDHPDGAESMRLLLQHLGYDVRVARTGPEGVQLGAAWEPDVVLCDIGLPGLDGYGVVQALRQLPAAARALMIALTGYARQEDKARALEAGFDHHIPKAEDLQTLLHLLPRTCLGEADPS